MKKFVYWGFRIELVPDIDDESLQYEDIGDQWGYSVFSPEGELVGSYLDFASEDSAREGAKIFIDWYIEKGLYFKSSLR